MLPWKSKFVPTVRLLICIGYEMSSKMFTFLLYLSIDVIVCKRIYNARYTKRNVNILLHQCFLLSTSQYYILIWKKEDFERVYGLYEEVLYLRFYVILKARFPLEMVGGCKWFPHQKIAVYNDEDNYKWHSQLLRLRNIRIKYVKKNK